MTSFDGMLFASLIVFVGEGGMSKFMAVCSFSLDSSISLVCNIFVFSVHTTLHPFTTKFLIMNVFPSFNSLNLVGSFIVASIAVLLSAKTKLRIYPCTPPAPVNDAVWPIFTTFAVTNLFGYGV